MAGLHRLARHPLDVAQPPRLLGPHEIRTLAAELDVTPTKKLGQNFVHDPNTVRRIVDAAGITSDDVVMEVGPGLGSLTLGLLDNASRVIAVEIDPRLAQRLPHTVREFAPDHAERLDVINIDALQLEPSHVTPAEDSLPPVGAPTGAPTALVANLPYNVAVPVLLTVLERFASISKVLVMVQLEVADRLAAAPGSKIYGVPSVKAAFYGDVSKAGTIGKNVFWPAPNVESGLVRIDVRDKGWPREAHKEVFPLIDAAFAQRRKTLRAALASHYGSAAAAEDALRAAGIDPTLRGEKLEIDDFVRLAGVGA